MSNKKSKLLSKEKNLEFAISLKRFHNYFSSKDDLRPALNYTIYSKNIAVATDGHLLAIRTFNKNLSKSDDIKLFKNVTALHKDLLLEDEIVDKILEQSGEEFNPKEKYPRIKSILNDSEGDSKSVAFQIDVLYDAIDYCKKEGFDYIITRFNNNDKGNFMFAKKINTEEVIAIIVMPVMFGSEFKKFEDKLKFSNGKCNIEYINEFVENVSGIDLKKITNTNTKKTEETGSENTDSTASKTKSE